MVRTRSDPRKQLKNKDHVNKAKINNAFQFVAHRQSYTDVCIELGSGNRCSGVEYKH